MQKIKKFILTQNDKAKQKKFFSSIEEGKFSIIKEMLEQGQVDPHIMDSLSNIFAIIEQNISRVITESPYIQKSLEESN